MRFADRGDRLYRANTAGKSTNYYCFEVLYLAVTLTKAVKKLSYSSSTVQSVYLAITPLKESW